MPNPSILKNEDTRNRVHQIDVQGIAVLSLDFSQASPQQTLTMMDQYQKTLASASPDSIRILSNVTDMTYDAGVSSKWKAIRMEYDPYVRASAVIGANSFMSIAVQSYTDLMSWLKLPRAKTKIRLFKNRDDALAWLIKT